MIDVDSFSEDQKKFLSFIVDDLSGPTTVGSLLYIIENILYTLKPDWELSTFSDNQAFKNDIEVCLAALHYLKVKDATSE